jgi:hypothetical protein
MPPERWTATTAAEGWSVGTAAHHVAAGHLSSRAIDFVLALADGREVPELTIAQLHANNARHAAEHAHCDQAETLAILRANGPAVVEVIRGLTDEQLDRAAPMALFDGRSTSAEQMINAVWIGSLGDHVASVRATA